MGGTLFEGFKGILFYLGYKRGTHVLGKTPVAHDLVSGF